MNGPRYRRNIHACTHTNTTSNTSKTQVHRGVNNRKNHTPLVVDITAVIVGGNKYVIVACDALVVILYTYITHKYVDQL